MPGRIRNNPKFNAASLVNRTRLAKSPKLYQTDNHHIIPPATITAPLSLCCSSLLVLGRRWFNDGCLHESIARMAQPKGSKVSILRLFLYVRWDRCAEGIILPCSNRQQYCWIATQGMHCQRRTKTFVPLFEMWITVCSVCSKTVLAMPMSTSTSTSTETSTWTEIAVVLVLHLINKWWWSR